jgi:hypothetical protein
MWWLKAHHPARGPDPRRSDKETLMGEPSTDRSPKGPREASDPGSTRHGTNAGSGANEPKHRERKEQAGRCISRQGGDQTRREPRADGGSG